MEDMGEIGGIISPTRHLEQRLSYIVEYNWIVQHRLQNASGLSLP